MSQSDDEGTELVPRDDDPMTRPGLGAGVARMSPTSCSTSPSSVSMRSRSRWRN